MKKAVVVALAFLLVLSAYALANQVRIGDLVLQDKGVGCCAPLPQISISQVPCKTGQLYIDVSCLGYCQEAWIYFIVDGNLLVNALKIHQNGCYSMVVVSRYNEGHLRLGWQTITIVLSSKKLFDVSAQYGLLGQNNFLGYSFCDFVVVRQASLLIKQCYQPCCCWCNPCCP